MKKALLLPLQKKKEEEEDDVDEGVVHQERR